MRTAIAAAWSLIRRAWCSHDGALLEKSAGVWYFVCDCGHRSPVMRRD